MTKKATEEAEASTPPSCFRGLRRRSGLAVALLVAFCPARRVAAGELQYSGAPDKNSPPLSTGRAAESPPASLENWKAIQTKSADGVTDTKAILQVADLLKSDSRLAGLMLRCTRQGIEPVIVVVEPFSPQARPKITLRADAQEFYFEGKPLPTGAGLRIPADGFYLVNGPWRRAHELGVKISDGNAEFGGVIGLSGVTTAIQSLADCAGR